MWVVSCILRTFWELKQSGKDVTICTWNSPESLCVPVSLPVYLSLCQSICLSACLPVRLSDSIQILTLSEMSSCCLCWCPICRSTPSMSYNHMTFILTFIFFFFVQFSISLSSLQEQPHQWQANKRKHCNAMKGKAQHHFFLSLLYLLFISISSIPSSLILTLSFF